MRTKLTITLYLNLAWSFLMLIAFGLLALFGPNMSRSVIFLASGLYAANSFFALHRRRAALIINVVVAALLLIRWLPMVSLNFYMFASGHELYLDSPATIFVVAIYAILFAFPACLLCSLYFIQRKVLLEAIRIGKINNHV